MQRAVDVADGHDGISSLSNRLSVAHGPPQSGCVTIRRDAAYGLPSNDDWYWQIALVTSAYGLDVMVAYTDTSIDPAGAPIRATVPAACS